VNEPNQSHGWFKAMRSNEALELLRANRNAFLLLYVIAYRAQWRPGFNRYNLQQGQALLGDHKSYGMSAREYRTAKQNLQKWNFATFQTTSRGTVATLTSTSIFSILGDGGDNQNDRHPTSGRQTPDNQATTTKTIKKERTAKEGEDQHPAINKQLNGVEIILRQKELERVEAAMKKISSSYDSHQSWDEKDRAEYHRLKTRKEELKAMLGLAV
jgi:hypothetical protein